MILYFVRFADLKIERRKLKAEKIDLLAHVKQLCASLQDKEQELRDFIRNFEHRIRETESSNAKMSTERERERWSLLKHAREEAERSIALATQLNTRDMQLKRAQEQLQEVTYERPKILKLKIKEKNKFLWFSGTSSAVGLYVRPRKLIVIRTVDATIGNDESFGRRQS